MSDVLQCFKCGTRYYPGNILRLGNLEVCTKCLVELCKTGELMLVYDEDLVPKQVPGAGTEFNPSERGSI